MNEPTERPKGGRGCGTARPSLAPARGGANRPAQPVSAARSMAEGAHREPDAPRPGGRPCGGYMIGGGTFGGFMLGSGN
jgi:hypothetical protein